MNTKISKSKVTDNRIMFWEAHVNVGGSTKWLSINVDLGDFNLKKLRITIVFQCATAVDLANVSSNDFKKVYETP